MEAKQVWGYDISAACCGFVYALQTGAKFVESGVHQRVLVIGADDRQLGGAGAAAALAAVVLLVPLGLALLGEDYYIPRALMPAWIPLAVLIGAACTASRAWAAGAQAR